MYAYDREPNWARMEDALRRAKAYYFDLFGQATDEGHHIGFVRDAEYVWGGLDEVYRLITNAKAHRIREDGYV